MANFTRKQEAEKIFEAELPPGLPDFVYEPPPELVQATYVDQLKPRKKSQKQPFHQQLARDGEPDEVHGPEQVKDLEPNEVHGPEQVKDLEAMACSEKPVRMKRRKGKLELSSAEAAPQSKRSKLNKGKAKPAQAEPLAPGEPAVEDEDKQRWAVLTDDGEVSKLPNLELDELQVLYDTLKAEPWVKGNNVYSSAYRKATTAGLSKTQAQLRGKVASAIFRKENSRLYLTKIAGPFKKPNPRKVKAAESTSADKPVNGSPEEKPAEGNGDENQDADVDNKQ